MELCLVRHAIAGDRGPHYPDDSLRPLTADGRARMAEAARGLHELFTPEVIVTSPLLRARQTADILRQEYGTKRLEVTEALATGDNDDLFAGIRALQSQRVMAVGHEPYLSLTLSLALVGHTEALAFTFRKGGAALVLFDGPPAPGRGVLEWFIPPRVLRRLDGQPGRR